MIKLFSIIIFVFFSFSVFSQPSAQETEKIAVFCKLWGFLKYHHPTVAKGEFDWDREFTNRINKVYSTNSKQDINQYYYEWIRSLDEVKNCKNCNNDAPDSLKFNLALCWISDTNIFTPDVINQLRFIHRNRNQGQNFYVQQNKNIGNTGYKNEKPYPDSIFPSNEMRLLGLSRYWNIINYFYPYKYLIGQNWDSVLVEMIPKFKYCNDTISYHLAMMELTAKINDSHAGFTSKYTKQFFGLKWAPFKFKIIDNKAIVTGFYNDSLCKINDVRYGDVFFDVRNYPNRTLYRIANFLNVEKKPFAKFSVPDISYPGVFDYKTSYFCGKKNKNSYPGKVIVLFNETSQSHAEFTIMALQTAPNITTIGSQTAGADGDVSQIIFPGNYKTYMTGIGVYYPDGRETQRVGIVPVIEIKPTIQGIKQGRDELMEIAIEVINEI